MPLQPAQDFSAWAARRARTSVHGRHSPSRGSPEEATQRIVDEVAQPVIAVARRGTFRGLLYCSLALTSSIHVVEFNTGGRAQAVLERLDSPAGSILYAAAAGAPGEGPRPRVESRTLPSVVMASGGCRFRIWT